MVDNTRNYIGIAMGLDVTDLKHGLQETKKEIQTANKKFAAETAGLDNWYKSVEGLNAKLDQLGEVIKQQKKNVAGISAELEHAKKEYGENSEQVRVLTDRLYDAQAALGRTQKQQRKYGAILTDVTSETKDADKATDKLSDSLKEAEGAADNVSGGFTVLKGALAGLVANGVTALIGGLKNAVEESREFRQELSYLEQAAGDAGVSFDKAKDKVADVFALFGEEDSAVEGINNLMTAGFDGDELDKIVDQLSGAAIKWHDTLKFEGLSDSLQETIATGKGVGQFIELLERNGIVAEEFDEKLAGVSSTAERQKLVLETLSSLGLEGVTNGYKEANKSLIESQKAQFRYNETMGEVGERVEPVFTTIKQGWADVLNAALVSTQGVDLEALKTGISNAFKWFIDEAIPLIKEFATFVIENKNTILASIVAIGVAFTTWKVKSLIQGAIALAKGGIAAYKLWALETEKLTLKQKLLNLAMRANVIGAIISLIAGLVAGFITLWNTSDEFRNFWIGLWNNIKQAAQPVIDFLAPAFAAAWNGIKVIWDVAVSYFKVVWENIKLTFSVVKSVLSGDFKGALDGIKSIWQNTAGWFKGIWNKIKAVFAPSIVNSGIAAPFSNAWNVIKTIWNAATGYFRLVWSNIQTLFSVVKSVLSGDFGAAWEGIKSIWQNSTGYFRELISTIFGFFAELPSKLISIGQDMIEGIKQGVMDRIGSLAQTVANAAKRALDAAKRALGINSPSKVFAEEVGMPIGQGIGVGLLKSSKDVARDIDSFNSQLKERMSPAIPSPSVGGMSGVVGGAVTNNFTQIINAPKTPSRIELYRDTKNLLALRGLRNV